MSVSSYHMRSYETRLMNFLVASLGDQNFKLRNELISQIYTNLTLRYFIT